MIVKIRAVITKRSGKAILVKVTESREEWIPLSQVDHVSSPGDPDQPATIELEEWVVLKKDLNALVVMND